MSEARWHEWCHQHEIRLEQAAFAIESCYYGLGFRTRPGTLAVFTDRVLHYSYNWKDTHCAMFEPSLRVEIPRSDALSVRRVELGFGQRLLWDYPEGVVEVREGSRVHNFLLQRGVSELLLALAR